MPPITPEESLIEAIALVQGVEITPEDYAENQRLYAESKQIYQAIAYEARNADDSWMCDYQLTNDKVLKIGVTVGLGFLSGGLLGAGIALVGSIFGGQQQQKDENKEEEKFNQTYGITTGGQLAVAGAPIAMAFGDRALSVDKDGHECGGVRVGGLLLNSSIITTQGTNKLRQLWALSTGADPSTGLGHLQHVDVDKILFDKQPRDKFTPNEIKVVARPGVPGQSAIAFIGEYSQNLSPSNYNLFGVDRRALVASSSNATVVQVENGVGVTFDQDNGNIVKSLNNSAWDAYGWGEDPVKKGGYFRFTAGQTGATRAAGLAGFTRAVTWQDLDFGWLLTGTTYAIVENGVVVRDSAGTSYNSSTIFEIRTSASGDRLSYFVGSTEVYVSAVRPADQLHPNVLFFTSGGRLNTVRSSAQPTSIKGENVGRTTFVASQEDFDRLNPTDNYALCDGQIGRSATEFRIVQKLASTRSLVTDSLVQLQQGANIFAYWIARYETTKHVTSVYFNLVFNVHARNSDNSGQTTFGVMFDIFIRRVDQPESAALRLGRFYVRSRLPTKQYRSIEFRRLPLGRYFFEFQPRCVDAKDEPVFELDNRGIVNSDDTDVRYNNIPVQMRGELNRLYNPPNAPGFIATEMDYENKAQYSSEAGATGIIQSVNEVVGPAAISDSSLPNTYDLLATLGIEYEASDRIQQSPAFSALVSSCKSIPNLMAAGTASGLSNPTVLSDPTNDFANVNVGWMVRNLSRGVEAQITAKTTNSVTTAGSLAWVMGDRYLIYFKGSSPYFPDTCAFVATAKKGGAGDKIDRDQDIDYPSFVAARKFCVLNKYFWNGLVAPPQIPVKQWTEREARGSLLIPGYIDGRWALFPDEIGDEVPQTFNTSNARNASMEWPDWTNTAINRLVVRYTDGRDLFEEDGARFRTKLVTIQTIAAFNGTDNPVEQTLDLTAVTSPVQAAEAGVAAFNSARSQDRTINLETSMQAAYLQGGKLIRFQHSLLDTGDRLSSFVAEAEDIFSGTQKVRLNDDPIVFERLTAIADPTTAIFEGANLIESAVSVGDLLLNVSQGTSGIISAVTGSTLQAGVQCDRGDLIRVLNLTKSINQQASCTFREDGSSQDEIEFTFERRGDRVWIVLTGLQQALQPLDPVNLGNSSSALYRVQRISPSGKAAFQISAVFHPGTDLYSADGLVVTYDDEDFFNWSR